MGKSCAAFNCFSQDRVGFPKNGLTFHRFPKDPVLRMIWVRAVCRKDPVTGEIWQPLENSTLCSKHFTEEMFDRTSTKGVRLRKNAVPEIFHYIPKHLQMKRESLLEDLETNDMDCIQSAETRLDSNSSDELTQNNLKDSSSSGLENQKSPTKSPSCEESFTSEYKEPTYPDESMENSHLDFIELLLNKYAEVIGNATECADKQSKDFLSQTRNLKSGCAVQSSQGDPSSEDEVRKKLLDRISDLEASLTNQTKQNRHLRACNRRLQLEVLKLRPKKQKAKSQLLPDF